MAAATADVLVSRLEEKHEEPQEKKQKMTDEEKQAVPYLSDDDDDDEDYFPGELPDMTRAELALYHQQVEESGVSNHRI